MDQYIINKLLDHPAALLIRNTVVRPFTRRNGDLGDTATVQRAMNNIQRHRTSCLTALRSIGWHHVVKSSAMAVMLNCPPLLMGTASIRGTRHHCGREVICPWCWGRERVCPSTTR